MDTEQSGDMKRNTIQLVLHEEEIVVRKTLMICVVLSLFLVLFGCSSQWERLDLAIDSYPEAISVVGIDEFESLFVVEMSDRVVVVKYIYDLDRTSGTFPFREIVSVGGE
jgi:hypothetical protein